MLPGVEIMSMDSRGLTIQLAGQSIIAGSGAIALYRLRQGDSADA